MDKIISWLTSEASTGTTTPPEHFHFYIPWLVFCLLSMAAWFYYTKEARKRFFGSHTLHKALLDRFMPHLAAIGFVGLILLACRFAGMAVFALRLWRYGWLAWLVGFLGYWAFYMVMRYRGHLAAYNHQRMLESYMPKPSSSKRQRTTARA